MSSIKIPPTMDYNTLVLLIKDNMQKNDLLFTDNISGFIARTESKLGMYIRNLGNLQWVNASGLSQEIPKPSNWRTTQSVRVNNSSDGSNNYLIAREYEFCRMYDDEVSTIRSVPEYYADNNFDYWYLTNFNSKDTASIQIGYYGLPAPLTADNPTNWWTLYCPQALFYGAMVEASIFVRDDQRAQNFLSLFSNELDRVNGEDKYRANDGAYSRKTAQGE